MLYKFFSCNSAQEMVDRLCQILDGVTLWSSDPTTFNDPFECKFVLDLNAEKEVRRRRYLHDNKHASDRDFEQWDSGLNTSKWYVEQETRQSILRSHGIACFTRDWNNELLWSHYARNHTGFCVGYDEDVIRSWSEVVESHDVAYLEDSPVFRFFQDSPDEFIRKVVFSKSKRWEYENEVRLLFDTLGLKKLPSGAILELTLGCRAPQELRAEARRRLGSAGLEIFQAGEIPSKYLLSRHRIEENIFVMTSHF